MTVTLQEWAVGADPASTEARDVNFRAVNSGSKQHELMVLKTDLDFVSLPTAEDGSVQEDNPSIELIGEIEEFPPGENRSASFRLTPGNYVLICNLVETVDGTAELHYQLGMRAPFTVT